MDVGPVQGSPGLRAMGAATGMLGPAVAPGGERDPVMGVNKNDFLKLLVAQLRNQDPLKPMEDKEFIAQMAQLNTVEEITAMNAKLSELLTSEAVSQASALIGKKVEAQTPSGNTIAGTVQEVRLELGRPVLKVAGQEVELWNVKRIT